MSKPIGYNVPEGVDAESFLSDELLSMLGESFAGVTDAFGDDATLYKIDIGKIIESVQAGGLIISGQFVDKSDGEIFNFEINQDSNQLRYRSAGEFLEEERLAVIRGESSADDAEGNSTSDLRRKGQQLYDLLYEAVNDRDSEAGQSPFGIKLSKDLDYLAALSAAMYHAGITIEAQPLYAGLHSYAIKYTLGGLRLFSDVIGAMEGPEAEALANRWIDENGLGFAASFVKAFSSQRCESMREQIQAGNQPAIEDIKAVLEEGLGMAMACTTDLIRTIAEAEDYEDGDVQVTLAAAIEEYCPIDNSDGYHVSINPRQLSTEWQEVVKQSGCAEDLSMQALGLPSADTAGSEPASSTTGQARSAGDEPVGDDATTDGARIFYVNVGEGPSRNWDDCRQFGFLAAGGGRKWSKQLEKIKTGDMVIAYLKGYGYVGIGKVVTASTPATKFMVNGVPIRELPLVNDTIRSIKRFSKENGEYLIGVDWQSAVPREQAAWQANAGLYTTALVCASLMNQAATVSFVFNSLLPTQASMPSAKPSQDHDSESSWNDFSISLVAFLQSNTDEIGNEELRANAGNLYALCPGDLLAIEQAASVRSLMNEDLNNKMTKVCMRLIKAEDEILALFFIGICELGDKTDEILEQLLDLIDEGMNLSTLATEYVPHNAFEVNALMSLIYWPEMPDWARAHLATRNEVGLTNQDRDSFAEYLGCRDVLGAETLLAICRDIAVAPNKYSTSFIKALKAFYASDFEAISAYNSDLDALTSHLDDLGDHCIAECRKSLGLVDTSEKEDLNKLIIASGSSPRLVGDELITKIKELDGSEKEDLIRKTGYSLILPDGSERLLFEDFYNAFLEAKGYGDEDDDPNASNLELRPDDNGLEGEEMDYLTSMSYDKVIIVDKSYMRLLGLIPGDRFSVTLDATSVILRPTETSDYATCPNTLNPHVAEVDSNNNLFIPSSILDDSRFNPGQEFEIRLGRAQIELHLVIKKSLSPVHMKKDFGEVMSCQNAIKALAQHTDDDSFDIESRLDDLIASQWASDEEFGRFFIEVSANIFDESAVGYGSDVNLFGHEISYSFYPGTSIWDLWIKARKIKSIVDQLEGEMDCLPGEMFSTFNIIPAAYAADYNNQSLDTWLANVPTEFSHEDNEFFCTLIAVMEEYSMSPLWDIVRNIRSSPVLDELIFCSPQLILSDEYLFGANLLENPSLSEDAISFLASLLLETRLPENFAGKTESDLGVVSVGEKTISSFRLDFAEQIEALDKEEIAGLINVHPKCTDYLRQQISRIDQLSSLQNMSNQVHAFIEAVRVDTGLLEKLRTVCSDDAVVRIANEAGFMISNDEYRDNLSARQELEIILMEADYK